MTQDTNEKILIRDHDILISVHTLLQESIRRQDEDRRAAQENRQQMALEMKAIAIEQARISTEFSNVKQDQDDFEELIEKKLDGIGSRISVLESKTIRMDIASYVIAAIAGLIAWFKQ